VSAGTFRGELLRSDAWRSRDFRGQRVAVVATADEAARIVPHVVRTASSVKVFQRSPEWILPTRIPLPAGVLRRVAARRHLRRTIEDPWVRRQLKPIGVRRVAIRPGYYEALQQPQCKLYTWPAYAIVENGIRSAEGIEHQVDVIIVGAGVEIVSHDTKQERIA
jgi:cation diffusion facilitator CzcD-associated flavoprotein CzcO